MPYTRIPYAIVSSAVTQTVIATNVAYPVLFETTEDSLGINRDGGTVSINSASPCTVTCVAPATTILSAGTPIHFTVLSDVTKGIALDTTYYVANISVGKDTFQLSSTIALARAGTANINTTGAITGTFECISRLYVKEKGDYEVMISALMDSTGVTGSTAQLMDLWFVKGNSTSDLVGTNVARSNTQSATDRAGMQIVVCVPFIIDLDIDEFIRLDYRGDDTRLRWLAVGTGSTPTRPACPSIILTIKKICR
jgi:hypothetical protein